jgi:outer membrane murein-binding lipoprotein Lpp
MIKDGKKVLLLGMLILALVLAGCDSNGGGEQLSASAANFDEVLNSVKNKPGNYVINLTGDLVDYPGTVIETAGVNIIVKGTGSNKITWKYAGGPPLFVVVAGKLSFENINLSRAAGNTQDWPLIVAEKGGTIEIKNGVVLSTNINVGVMSSGTLTMSGGTIKNCSVWLGGGTFTMSGGTIENGDVGTNVNGVSITMTGGTISGDGHGIGLWGDSENITISGGTISGNSGTGVVLNGKNDKLTMTGGTISGNREDGILLGDNSENSTVTISGGTISGNAGTGVVLVGSGNTFTMSGGTIEKSVGYGLRLDGPNVGFEKKKGGVIYGDSGVNKNGRGAIVVRCEKNDSNSLSLEVDAGKDDVYAAKINAGQTEITGKQGPNW